MLRTVQFDVGDRDLVAIFGHYDMGVRKVTTVNIAGVNHVGQMQVVAEGAAICAPEDAGRCSPELGEQKALANALKAAGAPREHRVSLGEQLLKSQQPVYAAELAELLDCPGYGAGV